MFAAKIKTGQLALQAVEERHSLDQEQKSNIIVLKKFFLQLKLLNPFKYKFITNFQNKIKKTLKVSSGLRKNDINRMSKKSNTWYNLFYNNHEFKQKRKKRECEICVSLAISMEN